MTPDPWHAYDQWEARDRTLLEAAALARAGWREGHAGYLPYLEYGAPHRPLLRPALDTVLAERYRSDSPDDQEPQ